MGASALTTVLFAKRTPLELSCSSSAEVVDLELLFREFEDSFLTPNSKHNKFIFKLCYECAIYCRNEGCVVEFRRHISEQVRMYKDMPDPPSLRMYTNLPDSRYTEVAAITEVPNYVIAPWLENSITVTKGLTPVSWGKTGLILTLAR